MVAEILSVADTRANCSTLSRSGVLPLLTSEFSDIFEASPLTSRGNLFAVGRLYATGPDGIDGVLGTEFLTVPRIFKRGLKLPAAGAANCNPTCLRSESQPLHPAVRVEPQERHGLPRSCNPCRRLRSTMLQEADLRTGLPTVIRPVSGRNPNRVARLFVSIDRNDMNLAEGLISAAVCRPPCCRMQT